VEEPEAPVDPPSDDVLKKISAFVEGMIEGMGYSGTVASKNQDGAKLIFEISSDSSNILIGKKGKNLDALQLLANVYLNRVAGDEAPWRVVLDTEGYRARREESLVRMAHRLADEAARTRSSRLLEPMNPFERRLIHTAINDRDDVVTKSEGDGLYKRVRIMAKGAQRNSRSRQRR
jgi:spoIIIJ-associated protein